MAELISWMLNVFESSLVSSSGLSPSIVVATDDSSHSSGCSIIETPERLLKVGDSGEDRSTTFVLVAVEVARCGKDLGVVKVFSPRARLPGVPIVRLSCRLVSFLRATLEGVGVWIVLLMPGVGGIKSAS